MLFCDNRRQLHTVFTFVALFLALSHSEAIEAPMYSLDAHVHFNEFQHSKNPGQLQFLKSNMFQHAILISPTYGYWNGRKTDKGYEFLSSERSLRSIELDVSRFIQKYPNRFVGACGLNLRWSDPIKNLKTCLNLPGMKGIKIHSEDSGILVNTPSRFRKISDIFDKVHSQKPFVIWHLHTDDDELETSELIKKSELAAVYQLAKKHSDITFILAHSLYSAKAVELWHSWEMNDTNKPLPNVFIEISTYYANIALFLEDEAVSAWRNFGMSRVLFGSDISDNYNDKSEHKRYTSVIENAVGKGQLSLEERNLILYENGEKLFRKFNSPLRAPNSVDDRPYFDAHIHMASGYEREVPFELEHSKKIQEIYDYEINELLENNNLIGGFLLSPTYLDGWLKAPISEILAENSMIVDELSKRNKGEKNFQVLCGVNISDPRALKIAESCLSLKGIAGLKIRFNPVEKLPPIFKRIIAIASAKKAIVLTHFAGPRGRQGNQFLERIVLGLPDQVQYLLNIMDKFSDARLIIAHSGMDRLIGINGLKQIGTYFKKNPQKNRNIYTEISFGFRQAGIQGLTDSNYPKLVEAWREFGFDFVFFGSDTYRRSVERGGLPFLVDFLKFDSIGILQIPLMNESEKRKVLKDNAIHLFN